MKYPYVEDADKKLLLLCESKFQKLYKVDKIEAARERLLLELEITAKQKSASCWLFIYDVLQAINANEEEYWFRGTVGSLVLAYLLGMTSIDPVACNPKLYSEFCINDSNDYRCCFEANVSSSLYEKLVAYFDENLLHDNISKFFTDEGDYCGVVIGGEQRRVYKGFASIPDSFHFLFFPYEKTAAKAILENHRPFLECKPIEVADYIKCLGLGHGIGVWEDNAEYLIKNGIVTLHEVIGNREDVYEMLLDYGVDRKIAFEITDYVRKGIPKRRGWNAEMLDVMENANIPLWFIESCTKIACLFPRAHWMNYCQYYKGEFVYE